MKRKFRSIFQAAIALLFLAGCQEQEKKPSALEVNNVKTKKVQLNDSYQKFSYSGQLESSEKSTLSFLVGGMIEKMHADEGQSVRKGEPLAMIYAEDCENELLLQQARLLEAGDVYTRMSSLYKKNSVPESDFIKAKAGYLRANAMVKIARKKLADTRLYAPYDGMIFRKVTRPGTVIAPGIPVYEIVNLDDLEIVIAVPQNEVNILATGDEIQAVLPSLDGKRVTGKITSIVAVADALTRSYRVKAAIQNPEGILKDGMLANVEVQTTEKQKTISIPGNAVVMSSANIPYVFRYNPKDQRVLQQRIRVGAADGANIQVLEGLSARDIIVVEGQHRLKDGAFVKVVSNG